MDFGFFTFIVLYSLLFIAPIVSVAFMIKNALTRINILEEKDLKKLQRLNPDSLELKRYRINHYINHSTTKRIQISLDAPMNSKSGLYNEITEELILTAHCGKKERTLFNYGFSQENLEKLKACVDLYNSRKLIQKAITE